MRTAGGLLDQRALNQVRSSVFVKSKIFSVRKGECGVRGKVPISTAKGDCRVNVMRTAAE